jgi:hypothetical protein
MRRTPWVAFVLAAAIADPAAQVGSAPPGEGDVRTYRNALNDATHTYLTLLLRNPKRPVPITMTITTIRKDRPKRGELPEVEVQFATGLLAGPLDLTRPHLKLTLDQKTKTERTIEGSVDPGSDLYGVGSIVLKSSLADLATMAKATTMNGRLFGVDFTLTSRQMQAITSFAARR